MSAEFVTVDGDAGGGQILRNGFSIAALMGKPIRVVNIRGSRNPPGLRAQHLAGVRLVSEMCAGTLSGAEDGSMEVKFQPSAFRGGHFEVDAKTAGSCTLLAQIALPCMLFSPSSCTLTAKGFATSSEKVWCRGSGPAGSPWFLSEGWG
eukprot:RCo000345